MDLEKSTLGSAGGVGFFSGSSFFSVSSYSRIASVVLVGGALVIELRQAEHHVGRVARVVGVALQELLEGGDGVEALAALQHLEIANRLLVAVAQRVALLLVLLLHQQLHLALEVLRLGLVELDGLRELLELRLLLGRLAHALEVAGLGRRSGRHRVLLAVGLRGLLGARPSSRPWRRPSSRPSSDPPCRPSSGRGRGLRRGLGGAAASAREGRAPSTTANTSDAVHRPFVIPRPSGLP